MSNALAQENLNLRKIDQERPGLDYDFEHIPGFLLGCAESSRSDPDRAASSDHPRVGVSRPQRTKEFGTARGTID